MPEANALKHGLGKEAIRSIGRNIARVMPSFGSRAFSQRAAKGIDELELKARVHHIAAALRPSLPEAPLEAIDVLVAAAERWERAASDKYAFAAWPVIELVGELGRPHPREGREALRRVTHLFSAEFAIRPFLEEDLQSTLEALRAWTSDPSHHVRRLVSEGTRPRLPWGRRVRALLDDPGPGLALLEHLKDDEEEYVRRSVANHLNDVAKDHPALVIATCRRWSAGASPERRATIQHALRTLVKDGNPDALAVLGFDPKAKVNIVDLVVTPNRLRLGESLELSFVVQSKSREPQPLVIDYAVHHVKKSGKRTRKTFKLKTVTLEPRSAVTVSKRHAIKKITTRAYHSGEHAVEILINGKPHGTRSFELVV